MTQIKHFSIFSALSALLLLSAASCTQRSLNTPIQPTYTEISTRIVGPKCLRCHDGIGTYSGLMTIVVPGNALKSRFYESVLEGEMPGQSAPLANEELMAIYNWIQAGAAND